ncbi:hypothetical protein GCM10009122_20250 [Fulvivirga kasyanovii]
MIVVPSNFLKNVIIEKYGINSEKIYTSPSGGVDLDIFKPDVPLATKKHRLVIGFVSRIDKGKGWDILLMALHHFKSFQNHFKSIIVGTGTEFEQMIQLQHDLELEKEVLILGGVNHEELPRLYNQMDIFVFPTMRHESLGLVGIEAMACGLPVIGSDIGGLSEYLLDSFNGYRFQPGNYKKLSECLEKFHQLKNDEKTRFSYNAITTARKFEKSLIAEKMKEKLDELINLKHS